MIIEVSERCYFKGDTQVRTVLYKTEADEILSALEDYSNNFNIDNVINSDDDFEEECEKVEIIGIYTHNSLLSEELLVLKKAEIEENSLDLSFEGDGVKIFLAHLIKIFKVNGGENFLTITTQDQESKYAITIQNCNGVTSPSETINELKQVILELEKKLSINTDVN